MNQLSLNIYALDSSQWRYGIELSGLANVTDIASLLARVIPSMENKPVALEIQSLFFFLLREFADNYFFLVAPVNCDILGFLDSIIVFILFIYKF